MTREELANAIKEYIDDETVEVLDADTIADYLIGKGVKVVPLKVGDKVYMPELMDNAVYEYTVSSVDETYEHFVALCEENGDTYCTSFDSIGKHVYFSREEAELFLKTNRKKDLRALLKYHISEEEWREAGEIIEILRKEREDGNISGFC